MIYEYRVYTVQLGKQEQMIQTIHEFFPMAEKHDVKALGVFHPVIRNENELPYSSISPKLFHRRNIDYSKPIF